MNGSERTTDMAQKPKSPPNAPDVQRWADDARQRAEEARKEMLQRFFRDAREEAEAYRQRRDELAKDSPDDPRLAVLDARILGAERLARFASGQKGGDSTPPRLKAKKKSKSESESGKP